ncbi:hypothetical protein, conserved [Trypanosoma brucei brucei TREU927]|uniref:T. brucei spp.-specific protein n=1 Tax=Trypanosoma brucei brucei (strain 927/4 GUTat10.1) TaxID=185431 RepID=Q38ES7_TRYB2|nr:hypothetical protein, conserved [Trypanosoma brucei brucei TREU927]EAN76693.1 hypothetical protein, conserved [Trypanosoma brucei brucei TREU927]
MKRNICWTSRVSLLFFFLCLFGVCLCCVELRPKRDEKCVIILSFYCSVSFCFVNAFLFFFLLTFLNFRFYFIKKNKKEEIISIFLSFSLFFLYPLFVQFHCPFNLFYPFFFLLLFLFPTCVMISYTLPIYNYFFFLLISLFFTFLLFFF